MNGMSPVQKIAYSVNSETESSTCPVCLEKFSNRTVTTICNHKFDQACLKRWQDVNNTCPMCRTELPERNVTPEQLCFICMGKLDLRAAVRTSCNHNFDKQCVMRWVNSYGTNCPICSSIVTSLNIIIPEHEVY